MAPTDHDLVRQTLVGDENAFAGLYERHRYRLHKTLRTLCKDPDDADDLVQDTFLQAYRKLTTFREKSGFYTWLYRIAMNVFYMRFRTQVRRQARIAGSIDDDHDNVMGMVRDGYGGPDWALTGAIDRVVLQTCIAQLAPGYLRSYVMHEIYGYNHREISELMGIAPGTSKSQTYRAKVLIRRMLMQEEMVAGPRVERGSDGYGPSTLPLC